jgi:hypothetical protein
MGIPLLLYINDSIEAANVFSQMRMYGVITVDIFSLCKIVIRALPLLMFFKYKKLPFQLYPHSREDPGNILNILNIF